MMPTRCQLAVTALIVLAALLLALSLGSTSSEAQLPEIRVHLDDASRDQTAHITDAVQDSMTFKGEVTLTRQFWPTSVTVLLELEMPGTSPVWENNIDPPEGMVFTASGTKNFTAIVTVPTGLPVTFYNLWFNATTDDLVLYSATPDNAVVRIAQYYRIGRQYSTEPIKVKQGESAEFNITIINRGNGDDTLSLDVSNEDELNLVGLFVYFERSKRVKAGQESTVDLRLEADSDAKEGTFQLNITIRSEGSASDPEQSLVTNGAEWNVVVEPSLVSQVKTYWYYIVPAAAAALVLVFILHRRSKLRREAEAEEGETDVEEEDEGDDEEGDEALNEDEDT